jgi:hypothetical protein
VSFDAHGYVLSAEAGDALSFLDTRMTVKAGGAETGGAFTRLACPGPWWDDVSSVGPAARYDDRGELDRLEARLLEADGRRVWAQQHARADLAARGEPLSRLNVARRACKVLDDAELTAC